MSKVVIAGDASGTGTFTISAPNGNTDRTLVLPDAAGTMMLGDNNLSDLASAGTARRNLGVDHIEHIATVQLGGSSSYSFSVTDYPSYIVYWNDVSSTTSGAHLQAKASYDNGSSYPSVWNYVEYIWGVNNTTGFNYNANGSAAQAWICTNLWDGASANTASTSGVFKITGCGAYLGTNKRLSFFGDSGGQSPSGQERRVCFGQTQDDGHQYNRFLVQLSSGTFKSTSYLVIFGCKG